MQSAVQIPVVRVAYGYASRAWYVVIWVMISKPLEQSTPAKAGMLGILASHRCHAASPRVAAP